MKAQDLAPPTTHREAFFAVQNAVAALGDKKRGGLPPIQWLAGKLGVSRQQLHNYQREGIPAHKVKVVAKITGLPERYIRMPEPIPIDLPHDIEPEIVVRATRERVTVPEMIVRLVRLGLTK